MTEVLIPVSVGELFDKITILEIKQERIFSVDKLKNIQKELKILQTTSECISKKNILDFLIELKEVNNILWDIENKKRLKEKSKTFDEEFIELARAVYIYNDKRALIKRQINEITGSNIIEEKSHE